MHLKIFIDWPSTVSQGECSSNLFTSPFKRSLCHPTVLLRCKSLWEINSPSSPTIFEMKDAKAYVKAGKESSDDACVKEAIEGCPVDAIS